MTDEVSSFQDRFMVMTGTQQDHGMLSYNGKTYKFKDLHFGTSGVGVHKLSVAGHAYHPDKLLDFS